METITKEIVAHFLGLVASCLFIISFSFKTEKQLLITQSFYQILMAGQLFLLNAFEGSYLFIVCFLRNLLFIKYRNFTSLCFVLLLTFPCFFILKKPDLHTVLLTLGTVLYSLCLYKGYMQQIRLSIVIINIFWFLYLIEHKSYFGIACAVLETVVCLLTFYKMNKRKS